MRHSRSVWVVLLFLKIRVLQMLYSLNVSSSNVTFPNISFPRFPYYFLRQMESIKNVRRNTQKKRYCHGSYSEFTESFSGNLPKIYAGNSQGTCQIYSWKSLKGPTKLDQTLFDVLGISIRIYRRYCKKLQFSEGSFW